jgi:hypothetical protein
MDLYMQQAYTASTECYKPVKTLLDKLRSALTASGSPAVIRTYHEKRRAVNHVVDKNGHIRKAIHKSMYKPMYEMVEQPSGQQQIRGCLISYKPSFGYTNYVEF